MNIFEIRRARLRKMIDEIAKGNVSLFAARFGYTRAQISQYLSENYNDGRSVGERAARTLEEKVSVPTGWLDQPLGAPNLPTAARVAAQVKHFAGPDANYPATMRHVPLAGIAKCHGDGLLEITESAEGRFVEFASSDPLAYAFQIKGNDLRPRIKSGECIIIEPMFHPEPGDDVLFKLVSGEYVLNQFLFAANDELTFGPLNESGKSAAVDSSDIVSIASVAGMLRSRSIRNIEKD